MSIYFVCQFIYLIVWVSISLSSCLLDCISVCMYVCLPASLRLPVSVSFSPYMCASLFVHTFVRLYISSLAAMLIADKTAGVGTGCEADLARKSWQSPKNTSSDTFKQNNIGTYTQAHTHTFTHAHAHVHTHMSVWSAGTWCVHTDPRVVYLPPGLSSDRKTM